MPDQTECHGSTAVRRDLPVVIENTDEIVSINWAPTIDGRPGTELIKWDSWPRFAATKEDPPAVVIRDRYPVVVAGIGYLLSALVVLGGRSAILPMWTVGPIQMLALIVLASSVILSVKAYMTRRPILGSVVTVIGLVVSALTAVGALGRSPVLRGVVWSLDPALMIGLVVVFTGCLVMFCGVRMPIRHGER